MLLFSCLSWAQDFCLQVDESVPEAASRVLQQRFTQMLEAGGLGVSPDGTPLQIQAQVTSRMDTPGSISQVALTIELTASAGEVSEVFPLKGVGDSEADAWLRAVKQLLPRSKAAQSFVAQLQ